MPEKLLEWIKESWLKPKSSPAAFILLSIIYFGLIATLNDLAFVTLTLQICLLIASSFLLLWTVYFIFCLIFNRLPKAPKNVVAVLFVIDAESRQLFEAATFKLVNNFNDYVSHNNNTPTIKALCVPRERVRKYNLNNNRDALDLLIRTNCIFLVSVRYSADNITNAENFELRLNCQVRHPQFNKNAESIFSHDLNVLNIPVGKQRFAKTQTLNIFNFTSQTLALACQYILGLVHLLSSNNISAYRFLSRVYSIIQDKQFDTGEYEVLKELTEERLFTTLANISSEHLHLFTRDKTLQHLNNMRHTLEMANRIRPDTYFYNLNMAYTHILLSRDTHAAKECIDKCKQFKHRQEWRYSEAFLSAYSGHAPGSILAKYKQALKVPYEDLLEIVEYIEFVLDCEPHKTELHLAAGLVYDAIGDIVLMKQHLSLFIQNTPQLESRIATTIGKMLSVSCNVNCNNNCTNCNAQNDEFL